MTGHRTWNKGDLSMTDTDSDKQVTLSAIPREVLVDEKFDVRVTGLYPGQKVTIHASIIESGMRFGSCGCYVSDSDGNVRVSSHPSLSGTYTGVEHMGLIWSMRQSPGQRPGLRLGKKDVTTAQVVNLAVYYDDHQFEDLYERGLSPIATAQVFRWYMGKTVKRIPVHVGRLRGMLFIPQGDGPFPGVMDMFGSAGGLIEHRASILATRGFTVLSLAFFRYMDLPEFYDNWDLNYFKEGVEFLQNHESVRSGGIGVVAVSKGAEISQLLAVHCPTVKALVTINGLPGVSFIPIYHGKELIPVSVFVNWDKFVQTEEGLVMKDGYHLNDLSMFKLWETDVKILSICSGDDQSVPPYLQKLQYDNFPQNKKQNIELVVYHGAGHLVEPPYSPFFRSSFHKVMDLNVVWGGNPVDHAYAQEDSWKKILNFLKTNLQNNSVHHISHL